MSQRDRFSPKVWYVPYQTWNIWQKYSLTDISSDSHTSLHSIYPVSHSCVCLSKTSGAWKFAFLSDAIHMALEHWQNAIQYLYLHLFTTKFVAVLLTLTQKCHISQISNVQKARHLEQPAPDDELNKAAVWTSANNANKRLIFLKFDYRKCSNILLLYKSTCHLLLKWT